MRFLILILLLGSFSCITEADSGAEGTAVEMTFDQTKWRVKEEGAYPYRAQMLHDIVYNDTVRSLNRAEILALLGAPDRTQEGHLYYEVSRSRMGAWTLTAKTLVIKFSADSTVEWIKIHG